MLFYKTSCAPYPSVQGAEDMLEVFAPHAQDPPLPYTYYTYTRTDLVDQMPETNTSALQGLQSPSHFTTPATFRLPHLRPVPFRSFGGRTSGALRPEQRLRR